MHRASLVRSSLAVDGVLFVYSGVGGRGEWMLRNEMNYHKIHEAHHFLLADTSSQRHPLKLHTVLLHFNFNFRVYISPETGQKQQTPVITEPIWGPKWVEI